MRLQVVNRGGRVTLSDLFYVGALLAVVVGVALLVGAFLGIMAATGAAVLALSFAFFVCARVFDAEDEAT